MSTEYRTPWNAQDETEETLVARTYWGGTSKGLVVEIGKGVADDDCIITAHSVLIGNDGSRTTLAGLSRKAGRGRGCIAPECSSPPREGRYLCKRCFEGRNGR